MHRQVWIVLLFVLTLALAACGDEADPTPSAENTAPAENAPAATEDAPAEAAAPDSVATEEATPESVGPDFNPIPPGLHARSGLTVVRSTEYAENGTGAYFAELRNDTGETLRSVGGSIDLLDAENLRLRAVSLSTLLSDIPPGASFFIGETFSLPQGYEGSAIWLDYTTADVPALDAHFDLPVTIETHGPGESAPYTARGTVENTTGKPLVFWVLTLAALDTDDNIIGLAHAVVTPDASGNDWPAGTSATFEATFSALAGEPASVTSVAASATGYAMPD